MINRLLKMEVHILNGDALKARFPESISGKIIVMRECLVDGDVSGNSVDELLERRAVFLEKAYGVPEAEYRKKTIAEIEKIKSLPKYATVNLWFEDDLFCQVNLWFCTYLLEICTSIKTIFLVRPEADLRVGFGGMSKTALVRAYDHRKKIGAKGLARLRNLWRHYQSNEHNKMRSIAVDLKREFPFLIEAVTANQERFPTGQFLGRPKESLRAIIAKLGSDQFGPVFWEFSQRESIYGYGDLQVKRLLDEIKSNGQDLSK